MGIARSHPIHDVSTTLLQNDLTLSFQDVAWSGEQTDLDGSPPWGLADLL